ncbi:MAG: YidC/Oxa1 family membrane protein insertase [Ruminococcaceae bacterium]|nr:YidC/Oxa1 family membrane protein insertase [Oscillospiraceae bacterium]
MSSLWDIINIPFGYVIRFCSMITGNQYILALLVFAVILEIVLLPFGIKQQKNSIKQAKLRPKEMAIRKKYAGRDDNPTKQKMSQEIQELYQKEGYNPMGGCLPLLIQFPVLIALFNIIKDPLKYICQFSDSTISQISTIVSAYDSEYKFVSGNTIDLLGKMKDMGWEYFSEVEGLSLEAFNNLPNLRIFNFIDLAETPNLLASFNFSGEGFFLTQSAILLLVPILTFLAYFFSMKMTRKLTYQPEVTDKAMGCSNTMMDFMMPVMSVFITFGVPAAIGVYWIFKSLLGVLKQYLLKLAMPLPTFTEEEMKAAEKEVNAKAEKAPKNNKSGKVVRSLHYIDDEDYEDTAARGKQRREALEAQKAEEDAAQAQAPKLSNLFGSGFLKKDNTEENKEKQEEKQAKKQATDKKEKKAKKSKKKADETDIANNTDNKNTDGE